MTAIPLRYGRDVMERLGEVERRVEQIEDAAVRTQAEALRELERKRIRSEVMSEVWFAGFKFLALAQVVVTLAVVIYRRW